MNGYMKSIYASFIRVKGWLIASIFGLISLLPWYAERGDCISLKVAIPLFAVTAIMLIVLVDAFVNCHKRPSSQLPKVELSTQPPKPWGRAEASLLLERSPLFGHDAIVSVYHRNEGFEEFIGTGFVLTIQEDGRIQILAFKMDESHGDLWDKIKGNDKLALTNLLVRPTISRSVHTMGEWE